jgi:hypothetical protein
VVDWRQWRQTAVLWSSAPHCRYRPQLWPPDVFGAGLHSDSPNCSNGADGGNGVSCWLSFPLSAGKSYRISVKVTQTNAAGEYRWDGYLTDEVTGITAPNTYFWTTASYGKLSAQSSQWLECWPYNTGPAPANRECQPRYKAKFGPPTAYVNGVAVLPKTYQYLPPTLDDKCALAANTPNFNATVDPKTYEMTAVAGILRGCAPPPSLAIRSSFPPSPLSPASLLCPLPGLPPRPPAL